MAYGRSCFPIPVLTEAIPFDIRCPQPNFHPPEQRARVPAGLGEARVALGTGMDASLALGSPCFAGIARRIEALLGAQPVIDLTPRPGLPL
jgi:hypothetical protein